jgi:hypothetical protein
VTADADALGDLVRALLLRYADVTPQGLFLGEGQPPLRETMATFLRTAPARTLYRDRRPACRSLDGLRGRDGKVGASCADLGACVPQVLLDVEIDRRPYRLLLAFTSARNFLLFVDERARRGADLRATPFTLRVLDRGRWGELRFEVAAP